MNPAPAVNYTISQLQEKMSELSNKIRTDYYGTLKKKMVTSIIPGREAEGLVSVPVNTVDYFAGNIAKRNEYKKTLDPETQQTVNNLYAGLQNAINLPLDQRPVAPVAPARRGGRYSKRRSTKRSSKKRRNTKRRRGTRK
uniref:Uncharacterized protein n=1 Tax=viral metagenome TaxID=1070528 RepID=A0A6C0IIV7_9ZZZZ